MVRPFFAPIILAVILALVSTAIAQGGQHQPPNNHTSGYQNPSKLQPTRNITIKEGDHRFDYRNIIFTYIQQSNAIELLSRSVDQSGGVRTVDAIRGAAFFPTNHGSYAPAAFLYYKSIDETITQGSPAGITADVSESDSYVAKVYNRIEERTSNGTVVKTTRLATLTWAFQVNAPTQNVASASYVSTSAGFTVAFTFSVSNIVGILSSNVTITPRLIETVIDILNYTYADPSNHLALITHTAHASANASVVYNSEFSSDNNQTIIKAGSGLSEIYFNFNGQAECNGTTVPVTISGTSNHSVGLVDLENSVLTGHLNSILHLNKEFHSVIIEFTPGATYITYDPSAGFDAPDSAATGAPADPSSSTSSFTLPTFIFTVLALFLALSKL